MVFRFPLHEDPDETLCKRFYVIRMKNMYVKQVRGIGGKLAYHMEPVVFSIDGMNLQYTWHRGEKQTANTISAGMLAEW